MKSISQIKKQFFKNLNDLPDKSPIDVKKKLDKIYVPEASWRGFYPINEIKGTLEIYDKFWSPLLESFPDLERRDSLFIGGDYQDKVFVGAIGHYCGTFRKPWLGIPHNGRTTYLRYGEFYEITPDNKIKESTIIIDVIDFIRQAGFSVLPPSLGVETMWPAPIDGQGTWFSEQNEKVSQESLALTLAMHRSINTYDDVKNKHKGRDGFLHMSQKNYWHPKMMWYGPAGIGTTRGLQGFVDQHQLPFRTAFPNRRGVGHYVNIGDGNYSATGGWPSVKGYHLGGGWLGTSPTQKEIEMRVMDFYYREENLIRENWVPIDMVHILLQMEIDVFAKLDHFINPDKYV